MDSDAHVMTDVGNHRYCEELVKTTGFPEELIVNRSAELLEACLREKVSRQ